ncbi:tripartite tricarboxylate transporter TctB family protein [Saccharopolyspora erythraea]|uniref:tripartite tricarboxylate transporter TctB family protein n=1 Tax=Saccharopolyspora erythraea TaxID=1836 RepID=UPI001BAC4597|nr:tripartite tricarboxylate transporter TctB family protein [Saccharopolyspora erythraea]QUH02827.1 tripartite tricarboxylate transporter TctB family protein [Saccharopolyspora erythraea]
MNPARRQEIVLYGGLVVLGVAVAVGAVGYGVLLPRGRVGPGFLPLAAGGLLAVLSALLLRQRLRAAPPPQEPEGTDQQGRDARQRRRILRRVFALLLGAVLLMPVLGMVVSFGLLVLVISTWLEGRRWPQALAMSAGCAVATHVVFAVLLRVPLPTGLLGV